MDEQVAFVISYENLTTEAELCIRKHIKQSVEKGGCGYATGVERASAVLQFWYSLAIGYNKDNRVDTEWLRLRGLICKNVVNVSDKIGTDALGAGPGTVEANSRA